MANQVGIAIAIKAFLPTGKSLDEQFAALSIVKTAHETGDYSALLTAAKVEEVKTEQKTRRIEDQPQGQAEGESQKQGETEDSDKQPATEKKHEPEADTKKPDPVSDADVPEFLKKGKSAKAA